MRKLFCLLICLLSLSTAAAAAELVEEGALQSQLPSSVRDIMTGIDFETDFSDGVAQILDSAAAAAGGTLKSALYTAAQLLAVTLLCSIAAGLEAGKLPRIITVAGTLAAAAIGLGMIRTASLSGGNTLDQLRTYTDTLLPAIAMATASSGGFTAASTLYVGTVLFVDILTNLITRLLQPLVYVYLALACAGAALADSALDRLRDTVGWLISASLKTVLFVFTAYLTITGAISGSADATTVKAAKLTLSGVVPVVGSMISDASETLVVSASILRNSIGIFGMLAVLAMCAVPFLQAGVRYLVLKLTSAIASIFDNAKVSTMIGALSTATGYILAMTGSCALMLVISFVCYIKVV